MKAAELEELGQRAVACPRWRWLPGMAILGSKGRRVVVLGLSGAPEATSGMTSRAIGPDELPDLSSPATLGCLLHLVRERWQLPLRSPEYWPADGAEPEYWSMEMYDEYICGDTEAEALVAALEAAL